MSYAVVDYLDMWGGNISEVGAVGWQEAISKSKELIGTNAGRCVVIHHDGPNSYQLYLKEAVKTNPSDERALHKESKTMFYADVV